MFEIISNDTAKTHEIAAHLAQEALTFKPQNPQRAAALVIGLVGELGSGKTTFTQGFAQALGVVEKVLSPTFLIIKKFDLSIEDSKVRKSQRRHLYHIDGYRLGNLKNLQDLHFQEIIGGSQNIVVIEWADKFKKILPTETVWVNFDWLGEEKRKILIRHNQI